MHQHRLGRMRTLLVYVALLTSCGAGEDAPPTQSPPPAETRASVSPATTSADDGQWLMASKDYANTRFSDLRDITAGNVSSLKLAWTFTTGVLRGHEGAPLVVGDTMYFVTPFPNILYALDLANHGAKKWEYKPKPALAAQGVACCDVVNRGAAYADGRVFFNTLDGYTVAVNGADGREIWKTKVGDINLGETVTMAPIVVKGKVLVGNSGGEFGVRGWLTALNAADGTLAWRGFSTGPDADILIGDRFRAFYAGDRAKDLGVSTWPSDHWKIGGGSVWGWLSYDPELDLLYHGTGNPGPWNPDVRPGDNKWTTAVLARDPDDGQVVWAYQWSPHDLYDYDGINENVLLDLPLSGQTRKVLVRPERNGYLYVLDRQTGEVLSADPYVHITTSKGFDYQTGRVIEEPSRPPAPDSWPRACARQHPAARTGSRRRGRHARACCTSRTTTCAWTWRASRPTTSPARPTWARR